MFINAQIYMTFMKEISGVAILKDEKILLVWRDDMNQYEIPGGKIKPGEIEEFAAVREAKEIIGCPVDVIKKFMNIEIDVNGEKMRSHIYQGYIREQFKPRIQQPEIFSEIAWVPIAEHTKFKLAPNVRAFCEKYLA